jgi:site-specific DNA-methyltransferase (adenine-specific)
MKREKKGGNRNGKKKKKVKKTRKTACNINIVCGDCMEKLKEIPERSIDMVLCDPPYGTTQNKWDTILPLEEMWYQLKRICQPSACIVFFCAQPFTSRLVMSNPKMFKQALVWSKNTVSGHLNANMMHMKKHEDIVLFYKKPPVFNKQWITGKRPYKSSTANPHPTTYGPLKEKKSSNRTDGRRNPHSILEFNTVDVKKRHHSSEKPVPLLEYLIRTFSHKGHTILDFTMGSGSTGVAAKRLGRSFIGIELNKEFYEIAKKRIEEASETSF